MVQRSRALLVTRADYQFTLGIAGLPQSTYAASAFFDKLSMRARGRGEFAGSPNSTHFQSSDQEATSWRYSRRERAWRVVLMA